MMRHRRFVSAAIALLVALSIALIAVGVSQGILSDQSQSTTVIGGSTTATTDQATTVYLPGGFDKTRSDLTVDELSSFADFPVYSAGKQVGPYLLTAILREDRKVEEPTGFAPVAVNRLSLIYGDCVPSGETGCAPPVEIQIWPNCERPLAWAKALVNTKALGETGDSAPKRGVPAVELPNRTELSTGDETIVVFGEPKLQAQAVSQLKPASNGVNDTSKSSVTLPAPVPGALEPHSSCTRAGS